MKKIAMKHKAFQSAIYKQYNIICWYITNSFLLLERHHVTIMVSKTYRMSRRAEYQLFSWHTDGDEHFGGMSVLLDSIKRGILSMKHFLLRIRNQTQTFGFHASMPYHWSTETLFGELVHCLVASPMGLNHTQLTLAAILAISFFFLLVSGFASS